MTEITAWELKRLTKTTNSGALPERGVPYGIIVGASEWRDHFNVKYRSEMLLGSRQAKTFEVSTCLDIEWEGELDLLYYFFLLYAC